MFFEVKLSETFFCEMSKTSFFCKQPVSLYTDKSDAVGWQIELAHASHTTAALAWRPA